MQRRKVIPYNPRLKQLARNLRNNSTLSEIRLWKAISGKQMLGYDFHRQKPIDNYILDFFCHELMLGIELDGFTHIYFDEVANDDMIKERRMNELGIKIIRFSDREVLNDIANVLRVVEAYIYDWENRNSRCK